jgi:hypothetical protein
MNSSRSGYSRGTEHMIERQMLLWQARLKAARERAISEKRSESETARKIYFLTICRHDGTFGDQVATGIASRTGWHVFDKEIVNYIAENGHVRENLVRQLDERSQGLIQDTITRLLRMPEWASFGSDEYHQALLKTLAFLSTQGNAILVGRGANFALRKEEHGLHVRMIASMEVRVQRMSHAWHVSPAHARRRILATDEERRNFVRRQFKQDIDDLRFYDVVLNTDGLTVDEAVGCVLAVLNPGEAGMNLTGVGAKEGATSNIAAMNG